MEDYRLQGRGGKGIITMKTTDKTGPVAGVVMVTDEDQVILVTDRGKVIRIRMNEIRVIGRNTQGVRLIEHEEGERVSSVARLVEREEGDVASNGNGEAASEAVEPVEAEDTEPGD
jgi:DNA gyrase subunit A